MSGDEDGLQIPVRVQVEVVRAAGLPWLDTSKHAALDLSLLEAAAETVNGYRPTMTRTAKVDLLLRHEIDLMTATPSFQALLRTLFGLTPETAGKLPIDLRPEAAKQALQSKGHFSQTGRLEDQLLDALTAQIVADCFRGDSRPKHSLDFPEHIPFIPRPVLQAKFERYVDEDKHRLISIEGEPGNGKSRLARELIRAKLGRGDTVVYIRGERLLADIAGALATANFVASTSSAGSDEGLRRSFAAYVSSDRCPTYVLLDDVADPALVDDLVPPSCRSVVVVTSREAALPQGRGVALPVKEMDRNEAAELVHHVRPQTTTSEADLLVMALGARPLAIVHACGFVGDGRAYTVEQFCRDLSEDAAATMGKAVRPIEWTLTWIYKRFLTRLQVSEDEIERDAAILLEFLAFFASEVIPYELVAFPFAYRLVEQLGRHAEPEAQRIRFTGALRRVQRAYLVEPRPTGLSMHQLTQNLLSGIIGRLGTIETTLTMLMGSIVIQLREKTPLGAVVLDGKVMPWIPHIVKVTDTIFRHIEPEKWEALDVFSALSVAMTGLRQAGQVGEALRIRGQYAQTLGRLVPHLRQVGPSLQSQGFRAFGLDLITSSFDLNECSYDEYLKRISSVLGEAMPGRVPHVFPNELLMVTQRSIDSGVSPHERFEQFASATSESYRDMLPEGLAEFHRQRGEAHLLCGEWQDARSDLETAWSLYGSLGDDKVKRYGQARTLKNVLDLDCYSGAGFSEENLLRLGQLEIRPEDGVLTDAFVANATLRVYTQIALYRANSHQDDGSESSEYPIDGSQPSYRSLTELFLRAYLGYVRHGSPRLAIGLIVDRASAWGAFDEDEEIDQNLEEAANVAMEKLMGLDCWPNPLEMLTWGGKSALLSQQQFPMSAIERLLGEAETAITRNRAPYLGYEGLMVALLAARINSKGGSAESLTGVVPGFVSLQKGLERLGLGHRWQAFETAVNAIDSGDELLYYACLRTLYMF